MKNFHFFWLLKSFHHHFFTQQFLVLQNAYCISFLGSFPKVSKTTPKLLSILCRCQKVLTPLLYTQIVKIIICIPTKLKLNRVRNWVYLILFCIPVSCYTKIVWKNRRNGWVNDWKKNRWMNEPLCRPCLFIVFLAVVVTFCKIRRSPLTIRIFNGRGIYRTFSPCKFSIFSPIFQY